MTFENIIWQIALPLVLGFAAGFWVRPFAKAAVSITFTLTIIAFCVFVWEACTHQPTLLQGLGVSPPPDPYQQTLVLAKVALRVLVDTVVALPPSTYAGFAAGVVAAVTRALVCKSREADGSVGKKA